MAASRVLLGQLGGALRGIPQHDQIFENKRAALLGQLRGDARRLVEELHRRVGSIRSHRAILDRFKVRCEWYRREQLAQLAGGSPATAEAKLVQELALFAFDQGLTPVANPSTGALRPDLLDVVGPSPFYVEAKQYETVTKSKVVDWLSQVFDTASTLAAAFPLREAWVVIFRRGGPICALPREIHFGEVTLLPVLVDLAPSDEIGSRTRQKTALTIEESEVINARQAAEGRPRVHRPSKQGSASRSRTARAPSPEGAGNRARPATGRGGRGS